MSTIKDSIAGWKSYAWVKTSLGVFLSRTPGNPWYVKYNTEEFSNIKWAHILPGFINYHFNDNDRLEFCRLGKLAFKRDRLPSLCCKAVLF